nr:tetratricopeptide repeat protein [uncultured Cellulosilyticum sp.]
MKLMIVNVPWMKYYVGEGDEEKLTPPSGYNFQNVNGLYYGFQEGFEEVALEKFEGVSQEDEKVEGVTVIWTAQNRESENKVIGWYKNATVYRKPQSYLSLDSERTIFTYSIVAKAEESLLLPMELRLLDVKETQGAFIETDENVMRDLGMYIYNYAGDQMNYIFPRKDLEGKSVLNFPEYEMYFAKADEFLAKDLYGKAIRCFNKAIDVEPELSVGYECKGSIFLSLKMYDEAIKAYEKVIELEEENELAHYCLGLLYGLTKQYERSLEKYEYYLSCRPQDMNAIAERGIVRLHLGDQEGASEDFETALESDNEHPVFKKLVEYMK